MWQHIFIYLHTSEVSAWGDIAFFLKTRDVLRAAGLLETPVVAEVFARKSGVFAGAEEVLRLFRTLPNPPQVESLKEGSTFAAKEVLMRITGTYESFGMYETVLLGMLASSTGWATAARECVEAAEGRNVLCFGARHVHPAIAPVMERAAKIAGCSAMSCILAAKLCGEEPKGTVPHAAILLMGDTVKLAKVYDEQMPAEEPRIVLVDTFKDEAEALALANATPYGLGAGVWTLDINRAWRMGRSIKAGRVWTNCYHLYPSHASFGGYKKSGIGRETHMMMLNAYRHTKNILTSFNKNKLGFF